MCPFAGLISAVVVILVLYTIGRAYRWTGYWKRRGIVGPRPVPFFGNLMESVVGRRHFGDIFGQFYRTYSNAKYVGVFFMSKPGILVRDLEIVESVFNSFEEEGPFIGRGQEQMKECVFVPSLMTPSRVKTMFPGVQNACEKLLLHIASSEDREFEGMELFYKFAVESVATCGLGVDAGSFDDENSEFLIHCKSTFAPHLLKNPTSLFFPGGLPKPRELSLITRNTDKWLRSIVNKTTQQRRATHSSHRNDFLQVIMDHRQPQNGKELSEDAIVDNCTMFLAEGSEPSAITLTYAFYELARNPAAQQRLFEDLQASGELSADSLSKVKYLDQVIYETFRMHSTIPAITKVCNKPVEITGQYTVPGTLIIEPGTIMIIPVQEIQMDPEYFPYPKEFLPSRFDMDNEFIKLLPFPPNGENFILQNCVLKAFGMFQVKVAIAAVISKYHVQLSRRMKQPPKQSPKSYTLHCDTGVWIKFVRRSDPDY